MTRFVIGRTLEMVPVALLVTLACFALIHLTPGDPAKFDLGVHVTPERVEERRQELGLDKPLASQYWEFLKDAADGGFGFSIKTEESVGAIIARRAPPTVFLIIYSLLLSLLFAVPLAAISAIKRRTWIDRVIQVLPTVTFVMPPFWLALILVEIFSLKLGWLPSSGYGETFPEHVRGLTLPAITLALGIFPAIVRLLRSSLIDTMGRDFVEAARVRGLSESRVMTKHVFRNSTMSTVTLVGYLFSVLLSLTVVIEQIFAIPGLGSLLVGSVTGRDYPVVQALTLLFALAVLAISLCTDILYALLDPRVRL